MALPVPVWRREVSDVIAIPERSGTTGKLRVLPPISKAGDSITFRAEMDLIIGLTACSAPDSNGGTFKPIHYRID